MIQDLSGSKETGESITRVDSPVPLMHHDPDRSWVTDPDPDHPKGTHPLKFMASGVVVQKMAMAIAIPSVSNVNINNSP